VFQSPPLLKELNHIVHPAVKRDALLWQKKLPEHEPYYIRESAILFETGIYKELDYNILVSSPEHIRIGRIAKRDLLTFEEIEARLKQQGSEEEKLPLSDFQIINDGQTFLIPQVLNIHLKLMDYFLKLADRHSGTAP
jgi:dephospho-CoA kinase